MRSAYRQPHLTAFQQYLNELDQFAKRQLHCKHYGRYVDDFYVLSADRELLSEVIKAFAVFLRNRLCLEVNDRKTIICDVRKGVQFLGAFVKPHRRYVCNATLRRMKSKVVLLHQVNDTQKMRSTINSYLGLLSHSSSYHIRRDMFFAAELVLQYGFYKIRYE